MDALRDIVEGILALQKLCRQMDDREPHFRALKAGFLAVGKGKALPLPPARWRAGDDGAGDSLDLGPAMIREVETDQQRVDGIDVIPSASRAQEEAQEQEGESTDSE